MFKKSDEEIIISLCKKGLTDIQILEKLQSKRSPMSELEIFRMQQMIRDYRRDINFLGEHVRPSFFEMLKYRLYGLFIVLVGGTALAWFFDIIGSGQLRPRYAFYGGSILLVCGIILLFTPRR